MKILALLFFPLLPSLDTSAPLRCHSEQFTKAKRQLETLTLNAAQKQAIGTYEKAFLAQWRKTHEEKGCSHHESHANEFVAAASGVLSDDQFRKFRGRVRTEAEKVQNEVWSTGVYIENLLKIAHSI